MCCFQAGLNQPAAVANRQGQLTCKDSLLVGCGGAADDDDHSCPIVLVYDQGTSVKMQGCTLQYHPDSKHTLDSFVVAAAESAHAALSQCRLVGPAPGNTTGSRSGIAAIQQGTATLVRMPPGGACPNKPSDRQQSCSVGVPVASWGSDQAWM
jgi:hypothetical protein